jgi:hypothetical protein
MNWYTKAFAITFITILSACGGTANTARAIINGQEFEMGVQSVDCSAIPTTGIICQVNFRSQYVISDYLVIRADDVVSIYRDFLNQWIPLSAGYVYASLSIQGLPQAMFEGKIKFDAISNYSGDSVCAQYEIQTGSGLVEGSFCGIVRTGY